MPYQGCVDDFQAVRRGWMPEKLKARRRLRRHYGDTCALMSAPPKNW
jgi:hypothetical protein